MASEMDSVRSQQLGEVETIIDDELGPHRRRSFPKHSSERQKLSGRQFGIPELHRKSRSTLDLERTHAVESSQHLLRRQNRSGRNLKYPRQAHASIP